MDENITDELEYVNCDICGSDNYVQVFKAKDMQFQLPGTFNVVRCNICGLVYVTPRPTKRAMEKYYPTEYIPHQPIGNSMGVTRKMLQSVWGSYTRLLGGDKNLWSLNYLDKGKILDIGCGNGSYLKTLKDEGWETWGIDISSSATECARKFCPNILTGELHEANFPDVYFDVITMKWMLEHTHNPSNLIEEAYRILKDNGTLLIGIPNIESIEAKLFKKYWYHLDVPRHLYHFSPKTIRLLLEKKQFRIDKIKYDASPMGIGGSLNYITGNHVDKSVFYGLSIPFSSVAVMLQCGGLMTILAGKVV
jgi:2-polyprenyl-3-methyl-5-hydroxy-6-metoxy-1,4-benzoquinol methylase